jgi:hypothetical protein
MIESVNKRSVARFNRNITQAMRNATNPLFQGEMIFSEEFSISFLKKKCMEMNKVQWAVGFSILEISKLAMQTLFYTVMQPRFGIGNVEVLMSDTDSFLLRVVTDKTETECFEMIKDFMDFSNFPKDHPLYDPVHAKELGRLKSELPGKKITSFVGLKSKTYCIGVEGEQGVIKAKGIPSKAKHKIKPEDMLECLRRIQAHSVSFRRLSSRNHIVYMLECNQIAFSSFDDKRFLMCQQHSVPYGSRFIREFYDDGGNCPFCKELISSYTLHLLNEKRSPTLSMITNCATAGSWSSPSPPDLSNTGALEELDPPSPLFPLETDVAEELNVTDQQLSAAVVVVEEEEKEAMIADIVENLKRKQDEEDGVEYPETAKKPKLD